MKAAPRFNVFARPAIHCLCFIHASKIYARTHVKITQQWKFTLRKGSYARKALKNLRFLGLAHYKRQLT